MAFELTSGINVHRDEDNMIRLLDHSHQSFSSQRLEAPSTRELAEEYLREAALHFNLENQLSENLMQKTRQDYSPEDLELRFSKEKEVGDIGVVTFQQSINGLPIWQSDVSVRINLSRSAVISSLNGAHYQVSVSEFDLAAAAFSNEKIDLDSLSKILNLENDDRKITINSTRMLVYKFIAEDRFENDSDDSLQPSEGVPSFNLPDLNLNLLREGSYLVVTEVLFTTDNKEMGPIHWRAFVTADTGAVVYLRPFISGIQGTIFAIDPATQGCSTCKGSSSNADLGKYISQVPLPNLDAPVAKVQSLKGTYIELKDLRSPTIAPPTMPSGDDFIYEADDNGFAGVNAYYHCNYFFDYLKTLGIDITTYFAGTSFPIPVDPRGKNSQVNASCGGNTSGNGIGNILFGLVESGYTVGISSALRVVWHEFGHGLLWNHVDSPNFGFAHSAGDSMACIYADPSSQVADRGLTFPFMTASNPGFANRRNDRTVADGWAWFGPNYNTQYSGEQVLSSTLFRAYLSTGGGSDILAYKQYASQYMFYLIVQSCGLLTQTTRDPAVYAEALKQADMNCQNYMLATGQTGGTNYKVIRWSFMEQGLFQPAGTPRPITTVGQPPEVDIYINDGRDGTYEWTNNWVDSPDIWNRTSADGGTQNQDTVEGSTNYLYLRLSNRGTASASNVTIKGYQSNSQNGFDWPINWEALQTPELQVPGPISSNGDTVVGPFEWSPNFATGNSVLMVASNAEDPSILDNPVIQNKTLGNWRLVPFDNNIAQRIF